MKVDYFGEDDPEESYTSQSRPENFQGQRYGKWTVGHKISPSIYYCTCDCGYETNKNINVLTSLKSHQCLSCFKKSKSFKLFKDSPISPKYNRK